MKYIAVVGSYGKFVSFVHNMNNKVIICRRGAVDDDLHYESVFNTDHVEGLLFNDLIQIEKGTPWDELAVLVKGKMQK